MLTYKKDKAGSVVSIILKDNVGIEEAVAFKEHLLKGLEEGTQLTINLEKAKDMHLSIIQLIISAFKEAKRSNTGIQLKGHQNEAVRNALEYHGMIYKDGSVMDNEKNSFWVTGGI